MIKITRAVFAILGFMIFLISCGLPSDGSSQAAVDDYSYTYLRLAEIQENLSKQADKEYKYLTLSEVENKISALVTNNPDIIQISTLSRQSVEGRDIMAVKISDNVSVDEPEPVGVFLMGVHAREWLPITVGYFMVEYLVENYASDERIKALVDNCELWFLPVVNPDGYVYTYAAEDDDHRYWRKNRKNNGDGTDGVDINRNWGYQWGYGRDLSDAGTAAGSDVSSEETYRGEKAFSEPETQAIRAFLETNNPDVFIDYHSAAQLVLYPYGYAAGHTADSNTKNLTGHIAAATTAVHQKEYIAGVSSPLYPHNGSSIDYVHYTYGVPSLTVEMRPATGTLLDLFSPNIDQIKPAFEENLAGLIVAIDYLVFSSQ